jgi:hypothetical protein
MPDAKPTITQADFISFLANDMLVKPDQTMKDWMDETGITGEMMNTITESIIELELSSLLAGLEPYSIKADTTSYIFRLGWMMAMQFGGRKHAQT